MLSNWIANLLAKHKSISNEIEKKELITLQWDSGASKLPTVLFKRRASAVKYTSSKSPS